MASYLHNGAPAAQRLNLSHPGVEISTQVPIPLWKFGTRPTKDIWLIFGIAHVTGLDSHGDQSAIVDDKAGWVRMVDRPVGAKVGPVEVIDEERAFRFRFWVRRANLLERSRQGRGARCRDVAPARCIGEAGKLAFRILHIEANEMRGEARLGSSQFLA